MTADGELITASVEAYNSRQGADLRDRRGL